MRRILLLFALLAVSWTACSRSDSKPRVAVVSDGSEQQFAQPQAITLGGAGNPGAARLSVRSTGQPTASDAKPSSLEPANRALYDEAMSAALGFLADRKPDQALTKFEAARALLDNDLVNAAVRTVRQRLEVEGAADQVAADVETILEEGRADEAAKLGASALLQFGDTAARERITRLVRQAYSLVTTQTADRQARFKNEFEAAQKQHNLRAAVLALEETLQNGADPGVNQQLIDIRGTLRKYDELRVAAADLRRDPTRLEQSLATLRAAAKLWDTPGVQQEIAEVLQLLQNRRDRLAVVDFEVRGDVGIPRAGAYMADELMPHLKARYDLVDRDQINRIAEDLRAERITDDDLSQQQLGQAAKVQYLIVGSITPVAGFTVQARLVDVKTGLIMQTARIVAADADELGLLVADLAEQLLLNDQQKQLIDSLADQREIPVQVLTPMPVLPPPPEMVQGDVPMPIIPERPKPPLQPRNLQSEDFLQLPPPPEDGSGWRVPALPVERERDLRSRTVFVAVELGDNLFRRGQFREALIRYQFCLPFAPGEVGIRQRIDRCLPLAASAAPEPAIRPRLAIVDFATFGNPLVVTRSLGSWAAQNIAPYFAPNYDPVDRAELLWWMGRLGLTSGDLLADPAARVYLGRALNARYLLLSTLQHTVRFDVTTYLVDAEYGFLAGAGRVHAQRDDELKSCLSELAWLTKLAPDERTRVLRDAAAWDLLLADIQRRHQPAANQQSPDWAAIIELCHKALRQRPNCVQVRVILENAEVQLRRKALTADGQEGQRQIDLSTVWQQRQQDLRRAAEVARTQTRLRTADDRERRREQREAAAANLVARAKQAYAENRYTDAVQIYETAVALKPDDGTFRELALARARAEGTAQANAPEKVAARDAEMRRQREAELAQVRAQLEQDRTRRAAAELARRRAADERDQREYERLMDQAQQLSAKQQFSQAVTAAQVAKQLRPTPEADSLLSQLLVELARANAEMRGAAAKTEFERQLAAEREGRAKADAEAARNRKLYGDHFARGNTALQKQQYDSAIEHFNAAKTIYPTDAVLTSLHLAQAAKTHAEARSHADRRRIEQRQRQIDGLQQQLADAQAAFAAKKFDRSVQLYRDAQAVAPEEQRLEVLAVLAKAEYARDQEEALSRRARDEQERREAAQKLLNHGRENLTYSRFDAALLSLQEALRLLPNDPAVQAALKDAQAGISAVMKQAVEKKAADYSRLMTNGRRALAAKQYDLALKNFRDAENLVPGDIAATRYGQEAQNGKTAVEVAARNEVRKKAEAEKAADVDAILTNVRSALAAGKLEQAAAECRKAAALDAKNPAVRDALAQVRKAQDAVDAKRADTQPTNTDARKRQQAYQSAMTAARSAWQAKKLDEALRAIGTALEAAPNDKDAIALRAQVEQAKKALDAPKPYSAGKSSQE